MATDIFDSTILCKNCDKEMKKVQYMKNGFTFRAVKCDKCGDKIIHPHDEVEYQHYMQLRGKRYNVKLRMVGNSYAVSIPREIVNFINEQDKMMDELVSLSFERMGKISLIFDKMMEEENKRIRNNFERANNIQSNRKIIQNFDQENNDEFEELSKDELNEDLEELDINDDKKDNHRFIRGKKVEEEY